jgi:hypothetical protein
MKKVFAALLFSCIFVVSAYARKQEIDISLNESFKGDVKEEYDINASDRYIRGSDSTKIKRGSGFGIKYYQTINKIFDFGGGVDGVWKREFTRNDGINISLLNLFLSTKIKYQIVNQQETWKYSNIYGIANLGVSILLNSDDVKKEYAGIGIRNGMSEISIKGGNTGLYYSIGAGIEFERVFLELIYIWTTINFDINARYSNIDFKIDDEWQISNLILRVGYRFNFGHSKYQTQNTTTQKRARQYYYNEYEDPQERLKRLKENKRVEQENAYIDNTQNNDSDYEQPFLEQEVDFFDSDDDGNDKNLKPARNIRNRIK